MAKRIVRPDDAVTLGFAVSGTENKALEDMAHELRLSMASFLRLLAVAAIERPDLARWWEIAVRLDPKLKKAETTEEKPKRPVGRPPKKKA